MARKNTRKKMDVRVVTRLATAGVFILSAVAVLVTGYFIMSTLNAVSSDTPLSMEDNVRIRRIDSTLLEDVKQRLEDKTRLDAPRQGALQNPFDMTPAPVPPADANGAAPATDGSTAAPPAGGADGATPADANGDATTNGAQPAPTGAGTTPQEPMP